MAKCTICNSRKGKRKCKSTETVICSLCCGVSRTEEKCEGCSYFKSASATRNYRNVPYYSTEEMAGNPELEVISNVIETTLCQVWMNAPEDVDDRTSARLIELMLDKYHFNDEAPRTDTPALAEGFSMLFQDIDRQLTQTHPEQLVKVLAAVYRSIQRRTIGGSGYLQFISQFTGVVSSA